jgi:hypothetical protein
MISVDSQHFVARAVRLWTAIAVTAVVSGVAMGRYASGCTTNLIGAIALGCGIFALSLLFSRGFSAQLIQNPNLNCVLLGFAIPLASVGPISLGGVLVFGTHYLDVIEKEMCGVSFAVGLLYVGGIIWGAVLASWRRKLMVTTAVPAGELAEKPPFQFRKSSGWHPVTIAAVYVLIAGLLMFLIPKPVTDTAGIGLVFIAIFMFAIRAIWATFAFAAKRLKNPKV